MKYYLLVLFALFYYSYNVTLCNGISSTDPNVCGGHGTCIGTDECSCNYPYSGQFCQYPGCNVPILLNAKTGKVNQKTPAKSTPASKDSTTHHHHHCSDRGICIDHHYCQCTYPYYGDWCQNIPVCNGFEYPSKLGCSNRGECGSNNTCNCYQYFSGPMCEFGYSLVLWPILAAVLVILGVIIYVVLVLVLGLKSPKIKK
jgi:hypothetical protein